MTTPKRRPGRPVSTERGRETRTRVAVSLSPEEAHVLERVAAARHLTVATYVREAAMAAAEREDR